MAVSLRSCTQPIMIRATLAWEWWQSGVTYYPLSPRVYRNPYPTYAKLRVRDPVHWNFLSQSWIVSRYRDIDAVLRDHTRFSSDSRSRQEHMGLDTLNAALANLEHGVEHFTLHDLRRTARTHLSALGVRPEVAERCLNHRPPGIQARYDRHSYFEERREALTQWANLLADIDLGGKVTPIRNRA